MTESRTLPYVCMSHVPYTHMTESRTLPYVPINNFTTWDTCAMTLWLPIDTYDRVMAHVTYVDTHQGRRSLSYDRVVAHGTNVDTQEDVIQLSFI